MNESVSIPQAVSTIAMYKTFKQFKAGWLAVSIPQAVSTIAMYTRIKIE